MTHFSTEIVLLSIVAEWTKKHRIYVVVCIKEGDLNVYLSIQTLVKSKSRL